MNERPSLAKIRQNRRIKILRLADPSTMTFSAGRNDVLIPPLITLPNLVFTAVVYPMSALL